MRCQLSLAGVCLLFANFVQAEVIVFDDGFGATYFEQTSASSINTAALDPLGSGELVIQFDNPANDDRLEMRAQPSGNPGQGPVVGDNPIFRFEMLVPAGSALGDSGTETNGGNTTTGLDRIRFSYAPDGSSGRVETDDLFAFANSATDVWETHEVNLLDLGIPEIATLDRIEIRERFGATGDNEDFFLRNLTLTQATPVPEPATLASWLFLGAALFLFRRVVRQRRHPFRNLVRSVG